ncbi:signal peptidase I [Bacillus infantis]|uniref:Signal peptidase I n=1 Tax=Bacillus infantis TaxID=324767 RepID=A0A5D4SKG5_9BACI|nr:signal peptidase I [Bacillus infantis]TYS63975.1 signal peptidase I [Bacillus infantis]
MLNLLLRSLYYCLLILSIVIIFSLLSSKLTGEDPSLFGYEAKQVLSGSMEPVIPTGSIAIMKNSYKLKELRAGNIITYTKEDHSVTHRIVNINYQDDKMFFVTQGDKNQFPDKEAVLPQQITGLHTGIVIPKAGMLLSFINTKAGTIFIIIFPGLIYLLYAVTIFKPTSYRKRNIVKNKQQI